MIRIVIESKQDKVLDNFQTNNLTLQECSLAVIRLEQIKQDLISREFENDFEVKENLGDEDGSG